MLKIFKNTNAIKLYTFALSEVPKNYTLQTNSKTMQKTPKKSGRL